MKCAAISNDIRWEIVGVSSNADSEQAPLDLQRDVPTTADDVKALRELRRSVPGWLQLSADEIEALLPPGIIRRPPIRADAKPFTLD